MVVLTDSAAEWISKEEKELVIKVSIETVWVHAHNLLTITYYWFENEINDIELSQLRERVRNELPESELIKSDEDQDAFLLRWLRGKVISYVLMVKG